MKPNNLYYRDIAIQVVGDEFPKFYSSMYYMRAIAEEYKGQPYTGRKSSNKYLKDWYMLLTGQSEPQTHKYNIWYLRRIAKYTDPTIDEDTLNENQCLQVIADNEPVPPTPTPIPSSIDLTGTKNILSYVDGESSVLTATVYDENDDPISGQTVAIKIYDKDDDSLIETLTVTDEGDGTYTSTYTSQGIGDVYAKAECRSLVTETYSVQDCRFYDIGASENISKYTTNNAFTYDSTEQAYINSNSSMYVIRETISGNEDFEASMDFKFTSTRRSVYFGGSADLRGNDFDAQLFYYNSNSRFGVWSKVNGSTNTPYVSQSYSADVWYTAKVVKENGTLTAYLLQGDTVINSKSVNVTDSSGVGDFRILFDQTVMYFKNLKLKPL